VATAEASIVHRLNALTVVGRVRARRGEPGVWKVLDQAVQLGERIGEPGRVFPVYLARAEAAWLEGDVDRLSVEATHAAATWSILRLRTQQGEPASFWLWRAGKLALPYPDLPAEFARHVAGAAEAHRPPSGLAGAESTRARFVGLVVQGCMDFSAVPPNGRVS
jgi:hypothetical protein